MKKKWQMENEYKAKCMVSKCGDQMTDDDSIIFSNGLWFAICMSENCGKCVNTSNVCHLY